MGTASRIDSVMNIELAEVMKKLWLDPDVRLSFLQSNQYQLNDSAHYYLDSIDLITAQGFSFAIDY